MLENVGKYNTKKYVTFIHFVKPNTKDLTATYK